MSDLKASRLTLSYRDNTIIEGLDIAIPPGRITALIGPNGCGKSTILKGLARILKPRSGAVYIDGRALAEQSSKAIARQLAILPQGPDAPEGLTVRQLVGYGRFAYQNVMGSLGADDHAAIISALTETGLLDLADLKVDALSGGQRQRAWIAMALAQDTALLLLDEPTTFLDVGHQLEVLKLLERLNVEQGRTIVMVLHDINHAARFAHHVVAVEKGKVVGQGTPVDLLTPELLARVFGVEAMVTPDHRTGKPHCVIYDLAQTTF